MPPLAQAIWERSHALPSSMPQQKRCCAFCPRPPTSQRSTRPSRWAQGRQCSRHGAAGERRAPGKQLQPYLHCQLWQCQQPGPELLPCLPSNPQSVEEVGAASPGGPITFMSHSVAHVLGLKVCAAIKMVCTREGHLVRFAALEPSGMISAMDGVNAVVVLPPGSSSADLEAEVGKVLSSLGAAGAGGPAPTPQQPAQPRLPFASVALGLPAKLGVGPGEAGAAVVCCELVPRERGAIQGAMHATTQQLLPPALTPAAAIPPTPPSPQAQMLSARRPPPLNPSAAWWSCTSGSR